MAKRAVKNPKPSNKRLVIHVDLVDAAPPIWRRIEIAPELRLDQVHSIIQAAFEWEDAHLHEFALDAPESFGTEGFLQRFQSLWRDDQEAHLPPPMQPPAKPGRRFAMRMEDDWDNDKSAEFETDVTIGELLVEPGAELQYLYDFGDSWEHMLRLDKIIVAKPGAPLARCVGGMRACPPDDSGGIGTYQWVLAASEDPMSPDYEESIERLEWMADSRGLEDWDANFFDLRLVNEEIQDAL